MRTRHDFDVYRLDGGDTVLTVSEDPDAETITLQVGPKGKAVQVSPADRLTLGRLIAGE